MDNPGHGKVAAAADVGAELTLVAVRTSGKTEGEEQAGTEDEERATS